jgi:hypothetical protein
LFKEPAMRHAKSSFRVLQLLCIGLLAGCSVLSTQIDTTKISGTTTRVLNRHDAYINADTTLDMATRTHDLGQSSFVRSELVNPTVQASTISAPLNDVCNRTDVYDHANAKLPSYKLQANLNDTKILREVLTAGGAKPATN